MLDRLASRGSATALFGTSRAAEVVAAEVVMASYALLSWRRRPGADGEARFTSHRTTDYAAVLWAFVGLILLEAFVIHIIVARWSDPAAWAVTAASLGALWLVGDFQAVRLNPIGVEGDRIRLRVGLRWQADIPLDAIAAVERPGAEPRDAPGYLKATVFGDASLRLVVERPVVVRGPFGIECRCREMGISVDDPAAFEEAVRRGAGPEACT
jgi:hypothetical protein